MNIQEYLKYKNISLRALAKEIGISPQYLCDLSRGRRKTISAKVAERFQMVAPEIEIIIEHRTCYRLGGIKQNDR